MKLTLTQRLRRRVALLGGSYQHPDGTIELDIDARAGIDPTTDSEDIQRAKLDAWNRREAERERWFQAFATGAIVGAILMYWWLGG